MVYYIGSLRKIRFNRNILYCKLLIPSALEREILNLIGTFCIVNVLKTFFTPLDYLYLIGTFCIVNFLTLKSIFLTLSI